MYYFGATVGWSRAEDDCYYGASVSFSANGANVRYVDVARKQYQFSIGGQYNGDRTSSFADYATADVYINGVLVADNCTSYSQNVYYGAKYEITDIKTVTGYTFDGIVGTYNATSGTISKGGTIYLAFHLNKYTIHFECVGGIDGPPDVTLSYGQEYTLNIVPIRSGYTLTSWNTKEDGTGRAYAVDATLKNLTEADNVTVVLYAQWTQRQLSLVKVGSTSYGASFVRRSAGDEAWYDRMGSLKIDEPVPDEIVIQQWVIEKDGNITRVK